MTRELKKYCEGVIEKFSLIMRVWHSVIKSCKTHYAELQTTLNNHMLDSYHYVN